MFKHFETISLTLILLITTACTAQPVTFAPTVPAIPSAIPPSATSLPTATQPPLATHTALPTATPTLRPTNPPAVENVTPIAVTQSASCGNYPCNDDIDGWVDRIQLPPGFTASYVGSVPEGEHITSLVFDPDGALLAATMEGNIYLFSSVDSPTLYVDGFYLPIGMAFRPGTADLYIASRAFPADTSPNAGKVTVLYEDGTRKDILTGLPCCYTLREHQPNSLAFGPDGRVYLSIGALGDHGETAIQPDGSAQLHPFEAGILRFNPDGSQLEQYAAGLRNPYDLAFDAKGQLFATNNGPDYGPPDTLYQVKEGGQYQYPYYENCDFCPRAPAGLTITPPIMEFIPHAAPTGLVAYTASQFPANYYNNLFITLWSAFPGAQKIVRVVTAPTVVAYDFMLGLAAPIDVIQSPSGALITGDWATGHIFAFEYQP